MEIRYVNVRYDREELDAPMLSSREVPDEKWKHVDRYGHGHFWVGDDLPTLEWVITGQTYVGDEFDGELYDVGEWQCRLCGETVEPGKKSVQHDPIFMLPWRVTVEIGHENGYDTYDLTQEQYNTSVEAWVKELRAVASGVTFTHGHF